MKELKITIPLEPRTKKNSPKIMGNKKTGRRWVAPSDKFVEYQAQCLPYLYPLKERINKKVNVKAIYYMGSHRKVDISNLHSALHDILVHYEVVEDDNSSIIAATDGSRVKYDKEFPRTEITITDMEE